MKPIKEMSDQEIVDLTKGNSALSRARRVFSSAIGNQEQAIAQKIMPTAVQLRRMEFEAVLEILECFRVSPATDELRDE